jgi:hypothetical protein
MWQLGLISKMEGIFKQHIEALQKTKHLQPQNKLFSRVKIFQKWWMQRHIHWTKVVWGCFYIWSSSPDQKFQMQSEKLLRSNIGPTKAHMKSHYRLIKYVVDTKNYALVMNP